MGGCSSKSDVQGHEQIDVKVEGGRAAKHPGPAAPGPVGKAAAHEDEQPPSTDHSDEEVPGAVAASDGAGVKTVTVLDALAALVTGEPRAPAAVEARDAAPAAAPEEEAPSVAAAAPDEPAAAEEPEIPDAANKADHSAAPPAEAETAAAAPAAAAESPAAAEPRSADAVKEGEASGAPDRPEDTRSLAASSAAELSTLLLECKLSVTSISPFLQQLLKEMRAAIDAAVKVDASLAPSEEMAGDIRLIRFLNASKWDSASASTEYVKALHLRKEHRMDELRAKILSVNQCFFVSGGDELECIYLHEKSRAINEITPRTFTAALKGGPHRPLLDRCGNLVVIECPGAIEYSTVAALGMAQWKLEHFTFNEMRVLVLDELSRRSGKLKLTCTVMDMTGLSLVPNPFASKLEKEAKKAATGMSEVTKAVYPTTTFKTYMINLSETTAKMAGPAIKAFVPARSAAKLRIFSHEFKAALLEDVDAANLPERLGGELPDGGQWAGIDNKRKKK
jgi:hypothetical protein